MTDKLNATRRREPLTDAQLLMTISIGIFVAMYALAMIFMGGGFLKVQQIFDLLNDNAALIIVSCSLTIVMIGGGINISVGGVIGFTVMACAIFLNNNAEGSGFLSITLTVLLALGIGLGFGLLEGFLVSYLEIQPFIVTLAGMFLARGLTTILSVNPVKVAHEGFQELVKAKIKIPWLGYTAQNGNLIPAKLEIGAVVALCVVLLIYLMLRYVRFGRNIYALGGNRQSALMLGINVKRTCFWSYVLSGLLSGLAGFVFLMHKPGRQRQRGHAQRDGRHRRLHHRRHAAHRRRGQRGRHAVRRDDPGHDPEDHRPQPAERLLVAGDGQRRDARLLHHPAERGAVAPGQGKEIGNKDTERPENSPVDCFQQGGVGRPRQ